MGHKHGRTSIFGSKAGGSRIQGLLSESGSISFERARRRLAGLAGVDLDKVSDGDTAEYLSRGHDATVKYLEKQERKTA